MTQPHIAAELEAGMTAALSTHDARYAAQTARAAAAKDDLHAQSSRRRRDRIDAEREHHEQAQAALADEQARADEAAAAARLTVSDADIDADPQVRKLEERVMAGDAKVTVEQVADERAMAAGRVRFGRLAQVAKERKARRDAEQLEAEQAAAAEQHAREVLAPFPAAEVAARYDAAVAAVAALVKVCEGRNSALYGLCRLPAVGRVRGVVTANLTPGSAVVPLDGVKHAPVPTDQLAGRAMTAAGLVIAGRGLRVTHEPTTGRVVPAPEPEIVAEGRAQLAAGDPDEAA